MAETAYPQTEHCRQSVPSLRRQVDEDEGAQFRGTPGRWQALVWRGMRRFSGTGRTREEALRAARSPQAREWIP